MAIEGWYYLHINGELIYKKDFDGTVADFRESDFVRAFWPCDPTDRESAWNMLVEASSLGANPKRIQELAEKWHCDNSDAQIYAERIGVRLEMDGNSWCAKQWNATNIQEYPAGFGDSCLEALAALCSEIGYKAGKMWNASFKDLVAA